MIKWSRVQKWLLRPQNVPQRLVSKIFQLFNFKRLWHNHEWITGIPTPFKHPNFTHILWKSLEETVQIDFPFFVSTLLTSITLPPPPEVILDDYPINLFISFIFPVISDRIIVRLTLSPCKLVKKFELVIFTNE